MKASSNTYWVHLGMRGLLGPWKNRSDKPDTNGIYQRDVSIPILHAAGSMVAYSYYDGDVWYQGANTPEEAMIQYERRAVAVFQKLPWRGLVTQPILGGAA